MDRDRIERLLNTAPSVTITVLTVNGGCLVVDGVTRLKAALAVNDEVVVAVTDLGNRVAFKSQEGQIYLADDENFVALLGLEK